MCTSFLTSALDGGDWLALRPGVSYAALFHGKCSWYPLSKKVVWAPESILTFWARENTRFGEKLIFSSG